MKKIIIAFFALMLFASCGTTKKGTKERFFVQNPKTDFTIENISLLKDQNNLVGAYVSLSDGFTLQKGKSSNETDEFTENGIVNSFDVFSGEELVVPKNIILGTPQDGKSSFSGAQQKQRFLAPIESVELDADGVLKKVTISLLGQEQQKISVSFCLNDNRFYFQKLQRSDLSETDEQLVKMNVGQDYSGNIVVQAGNSFYYALKSGQDLWFLHQNKTNLFIDKFFFNKKELDQTKRTTAQSVLVAPPAILEEKQ